MQEINLYDLIKYYVKKWRVIVALTLLGLIAGLVYNTFIQKPLYKSDAKLILVPTPGKPTTTDPTLINNYIDLLKSRRVLEPVIEKEHSNLSYDTLSQSVKATNQKDTAVIEVVVTTSNAEQSKSIANDITDSFKTAVSSLYHSDNLVVVDPAVAATNAFNVHKTMQLAIATAIGLVISIIALFFIYDYKGGESKKPDTHKTMLKKIVKATVKKTSLGKNTPASGPNPIRRKASKGGAANLTTKKVSTNNKKVKS